VSATGTPGVVPQKSSPGVTGGRDSFRSVLDAFVADPPARSIETIQQLLTELQYSTAAMRLLARARCGEPVPIDLVREVIACADTLLLPLVLFLLADGDRVAAVVDMVETDAFPHDETGIMATATFVLAAALLDDTRESHPRLATGMRVLALACLEQPPSPTRTYIITAFQFVARELKDGVLAAMLRDEISGPVAPDLLSLRGLQKLSRAQLLELPALYSSSIPIDCKLDTDYAPALGRNAPCWCQSGKKFKRCHGAEQRPPRSRETRSHRMITVAEVQTWPLGDLATMRFRQLGDEQLGAAIERLIKYRAWDVADHALDALAAREHLPRETRDHVRNCLITRAMQCRRWDLVAKHVAKFSSPRYSLMKSTVTSLLPVLARAPDAIDRLLQFAARAVDDPTRADDGGVALLLHAMPALGILLVRAEIASGAIEPKREGFIAIDQARAQLGLPPGDPVERVFEQWRAAKADARDREADARAVAEARAENDVLREQISETNRQNRELLRRVDDLERQWRERPVEPAPAEPEPDPAEIRALRARILQLQDIVRDKNLELAELRRGLRAASAERTGPQEPADRGAGEAADDRDDRWEADDDPASERRILVPIWRPALMADIGSLPAHVAREALCTTAELAAGDAATWRAVKRAKGIATPILMARIGIHHRLLFCVNDSSLEVVELVTRESLHVTLKRYA